MPAMPFSVAAFFALKKWSSFAQDQAIAAGLYPSSQTFAALLEAALSGGDAVSADYWYQGHGVDGLTDSNRFI